MELCEGGRSPRWVFAAGARQPTVLHHLSKNIDTVRRSGLGLIVVYLSPAP